jgi:hypothetical protein
MDEGKQPQPPFAVVQQTWSERQLQLWGQAAARTASRLPFKILESAIVHTSAALRLIAAIPPMIRDHHRFVIAVSLITSGYLPADS